MGLLRSRLALTIAIGLAVAGLATWMTYGQLTRSPSDPTLSQADTSPQVAQPSVVSGGNPTLDENCTISILNRTVRVREDGSWRIDNIPANLGRVRARATCVIDGVTVSGQSGFFNIEANVVNGFSGDIPLGVVAPIPESLLVTAATSTLTSLGETAQLTVTALFSDDTTKDVTTGVTGTNYTVSNSAIATISPDGLVTAVSSGTALVSALNEGALGLLSVRVILGGDTDEDGIPDDVELANGLDPNNPVDALKDADGDNLTNIEEFNIGTDFNNADTDGDTIPDGEEIEEGDDGFVTNPLLADTDGDQITDGLEIATGSDPTDPTSFNLTDTIASLGVTPSQAVLTFNTIFGEASLQLTVTATLLDGNTKDLTSTAIGTNYSSDDLNICNFGADAGRVFAGVDGICAVTASNSGFDTTANITVRTFAPTAITSIAIPNSGYANNVDVVGDSLAFIAAGADGLQVLDVSNLEGVGNLPNDRIIGSLDTPGTAIDIKVVNDLAYIADGSSGLQIFDVSDPTSPSEMGMVDTPGTAQDVVISDNRAYVADGSSGLTVVDITDPAAPSVIATVASDGTAKGVDVSGDGNHAIVVNGGPSAAKVFDISDEGNIAIVGTITIPGDAKDVVVEGTNAFVAAYATGGLQIFDFSDPTAPVIIGAIPQSGGFVPRDFAISNQFGLAAEQLFPNAIPIVNVSDPADPIFSTTLDLSGLGDYAGTGIALTERFVYVTEESFVITQDFKATGNTRLFVGQYLTIEDKAGIPPTVSISSPADGSEAVEGSNQDVVVSADDDVAVGSVNLIVDGEVVGTDSAAPYEFSFTIPIGATEVTIEAAAIDLGNNIATSQPVTLGVLPDTPPTVVMTSPADGATVVEGSALTVSADASDNVTVVKVEFFANDMLKSTDTNAPYSAQITVPLDIVSLTLKAVATDNIGQTSNASVTVNVLADPPPTVTVESPNDGDTVIENETITVTADATDNIAIGRVDFYANGAFTGSDSTSPYDIQMAVPQGIASLDIEARAFDNLGRTASDTVNVNVILDPLTTVVGRVVDGDGVVLAGIQVRTFDATALTDVDGTFSILSVPTILGNVRVNALGEVDDRQVFGQSDSFSPERGGATDVGDIEITFSSGFISVSPGTVGVEGSGTEAVRHSEVIRTVSHMPASIFEVADGDTNTLLRDGFELGLQPNGELFSPTNVNGLHQNEDQSLLFTVSPSSSGVSGSGVEQRRETGLRHADVYRSTSNGTNSLFMAGDDLGLRAYTQAVVDAISLMDDGSVLFSVEPFTNGATGSAVDNADANSRGSDIYRSIGDGTNELFMPAADLGISDSTCCSNNVDAIFYNENDGTLLFSVSPGTQGLEGTAVADSQAFDTFDSIIFFTPGDGSNSIFSSQEALGIASGGVDALTLDSDSDLLFSATRSTDGVADSGIEQSKAFEVIEQVSQVIASVFAVGSNGSNALRVDGLSLGMDPGSAFGDIFGSLAIVQANGGSSSGSGDGRGRGDGSGPGSGSNQSGQTQESSTPDEDIDSTTTPASSQADGSIGVINEHIGGDGDGQTNMTALDILEDDSYIFTVGFNSVGRPGSAIEARSNTGLSEADIYHSIGDGTNDLFIAGDDLGILAFWGTQVDAISLLPDGSVLFSTSSFAGGAPGSAVAESPTNTQSMNIYRSFGDGTNELFMTAQQLGLSGEFCCNGNVDGLYWNPQDGSIVFSVSSFTEGAPGSAVEGVQDFSMLDGSLFRSMGDGTNELVSVPENAGIVSGGVDALAFDPTPMSDEAGVPPTVEIQSPLPGVEIIEGDTFVVEVSVFDDVVVDAVEIKIGDVSLDIASFPGASATFEGLVMPLGVGPRDVAAVAVDLGGNRATSTVAVIVIPDPLTTVIGTVVDEDLVPVEGVTISTIDGLSALTLADGTFSIAGVPTIKGDVTVSATIVVDEVLLSGKSAAFPPIQSGITDVETIIVKDKPDTVLIFGDRNERTALETDLTNLGFNVLDNVVTLPDDLTIYGSIWHVGAFGVLTADERTRLVAFVDSGRGIHLTGERPCCDNLNDSLELLVNALVVGGEVEVGRFGDIGGSYSFNPDALGEITSNPNELALWSPSASGGMGGFDGDNVLVSGSGGVPVGAVWDCNDMVGNAGRITLLMDVNWYLNDNARQATIENIHTFLIGATTCGIPGE